MQEEYLLPRSYRRPSNRRSDPDDPHFQKKSSFENISSSYLTESNSYESLLGHRVPSPSLYLDEAMSDLLSRYSLYSSESYPPSIYSPYNQRDSISTFVDFGDWITRETTPRVESALFPSRPRRGQPRRKEDIHAPLYGEDYHHTPVVKQGLSSTTFAALSPDVDAWETYYQRNSCLSTSTSSQDIGPMTPVPSLTHSASFKSMSEATQLTMPSIGPQQKENSRKIRPPQPIQVHSENGVRVISAPMPSPRFDTVTFGPALRRPMTAESAVDPTYQPFRPAPAVPALSQQRSYMEWDDDDYATRLARVKKSFGDLRRARTRTNSSSRELLPATPEVTVKPRSHDGTSDSAPKVHRDITGAGLSTHGSTKSKSSKLSKKQSTKGKRTISGTSTGTKASTVTAPSKPLPTSPSTAKKWKRGTFSIAITRRSAKNRKISMSRLSKWLKRMRCT